MFFSVKESYKTRLVEKRFRETKKGRTRPRWRKQEMKVAAEVRWGSMGVKEAVFNGCR